MNVKRFTARTSRDALGLVKQAFGQEAVVLSTRPCPEGVEVLAMAPESVAQYDQAASSALPRTAAGRSPESPPAVSANSSPAQDAERLAMSTLSFQDYVRERMLRRRRAEMQGQSTAAPALAYQAPQGAAIAAHAAGNASPVTAAVAASARLAAAAQTLANLAEPPAQAGPAARQTTSQATSKANESPKPTLKPAAAARVEPALDEDDGFRPYVEPAGPARTSAEAGELLQELRDMRGVIEQRFGALAYLEKLQRDPRQAKLSQRLLDAGFSPLLTRRLTDSLPADGDELAWAAAVLEPNLQTGARAPPLEDAGGVYALVGSTGVGKTTSTAKLAAAFATRHGAGHLGLITLDAYRVAAHEQLRAYGRILGVPVHTAHDRASLEDLLDLLSGKKMVLIDTAGMAQRDERTRELLDMLSHRAVQRLLVLNAAQQGETMDDVIAAYRGAQCRGIVLSKLDEAVKLGPALDALIRHKLKVLAVANGQRVPEDWHRLAPATLVQRALRAPTSPAWKLESSDVSLLFTDPRHGH